MRRSLHAFGLGLALLVSGGTAQAGWNEFWHGVHTDYRRMNCWPEPFIHADRAAQQAPFDAQVAKGWQRQCTLSDFHFNPETQQLTRGGVLQLQWILTQAPEQFRGTVYIPPTVSPEATASRIEMVQLASTKLLRNGQMPQVVEASEPAPGWPADYIHAINVKSQATIPPPRLPAAADATGN